MKFHSCTIATAILHFILSTGITVIATVCDLEPQQQRVCRDMNISPQHPFFSHPITGTEVFFFFDPPHLFKSIRNALVNHDIIFLDGQIASWVDVRALWSLDTARTVRLVPRLSAKHVFLGVGTKMSVRLAVQVFSHSVFSGLMAYSDAKLIPAQAVQTAAFVKRMNDLWDVFNCASLQGEGLKQAVTRANLQSRLAVLDEASLFIESLQFRSRKTDQIKSFLPSKNGLLLSIAAFRRVLTDFLHCDDCFEPGVKFLIGRRFNQDCVENCFAQIRRDKGSFYEMMASWRALSNLRAIAASSYLAPVRKKGCNCEDDRDRQIVDLFFSKPSIPEKEFQYFNSFCDENEEFAASSNFESQPCTSRQSQRHSSHRAVKELWKKNVTDLRIASVHHDACSYLAGYLLRQLVRKNVAVSECMTCKKLLFSMTNCDSSFASHKTYQHVRSGLISPTNEFIDLVRDWDKRFGPLFNEQCTLPHLKRGIALTLQRNCKENFLPNCHKHVIFKFCCELFVKVRIFREVKEHNSRIKCDRMASLRKLSKVNYVRRAFTKC